jgi:hypothetical protein
MVIPVVLILKRSSVVEANVQVAPPFKMTVSPEDRVAEPVQPDIPGMCFHGVDVDVPLLESEPLT